MRAILIALALIWSSAAWAEMAPREGWVVMDSDKGYEQLLDDIRASVREHEMGVVTQAGPTGAARARGIDIPGNRVIGVFNNHFAVRVLELSTPAMIEAPIRLYVTEEPDGTGTLSYKTPSHVFAPYMAEAGAGLGEIAAELDAIFLAIAEKAVQ